MAYKPATKASIKATYIAKLKELYPFYTEGSRPLELANLAADAALNGRQRLEGEAWFQTLLAHGLHRGTPLKMLAELPA